MQIYHIKAFLMHLDLGQRNDIIQSLCSLTIDFGLGMSGPAWRDIFSPIPNPKIGGGQFERTKLIFCFRKQNFIKETKMSARSGRSGKQDGWRPCACGCGCEDLAPPYQNFCGKCRAKCQRTAPSVSLVAVIFLIIVLL